jgi:hypothetical protein
VSWLAGQCVNLLRIRPTLVQWEQSVDPNQAPKGQTGFASAAMEQPNPFDEVLRALTMGGYPARLIARVSFSQQGPLHISEVHRKSDGWAQFSAELVSIVPTLRRHPMSELYFLLGTSSPVPSLKEQLRNFIK